jgi:hypothetical protein
MEKKHFLKEIMMDTIPQEQIDSAVVTYFENQTHHTAETVKAMVVVGLLMVGTYTVAKNAASWVVAGRKYRKELKQLKSEKKSEKKS